MTASSISLSLLLWINFSEFKEYQKSGVCFEDRLYNYSGRLDNSIFGLSFHSIKGTVIKL